MNDFFTKVRSIYDMLFPAITDENITRRTTVFYALLYLALFFTGFSLGTVSVADLALTIVLYLFLGLTASNFIVSHMIPNPIHILKQFNGFNLFICIFILYVGFLFLLGVFLFAFNINLAEFKYTNMLTILFLIGFLVFPLVVFFYYIKNGTVGIFRFVSKKVRRNVTPKE